MITLQFSTQKYPSSSVIRHITHAWCSHVDVVLPDGQLLGAHAENGVQIRPKDYATFSATQRVDLPASDWSVTRFYQFVRSQVGKPYDMGAILAFVVNRDWQTHDSWFCSELAAAGLIEAGFFAYPLSTASNRISPADLLLLCSAFGPLSELKGTIS